MNVQSIMGEMNPWMMMTEIQDSAMVVIHIQKVDDVLKLMLKKK